jgi:PAS domain S-box-containing protein
MDSDFTAETLAAALLSSDSDAIVASDSHGTIRFWNAGAERIFGHAAASALGQSLDIIIPERLRARHWEGYRRVMAGAESRYGAGDLLSVPALRADGSQLSVEFTIGPVRSVGGDIVGLIAVMRDVTLRFEETRVLRQKLRALAEPAPGR